MITKDAVTEKLKKLFAKREQAPQNQPLMRPKREWTTGLLIAACLFLLSAALSAYTFLKNRTVVAPVSETEEAVVYRESTVEEVLATIREREERFNTLTGEAVEIVEVEEEEMATSTEEIIFEAEVATGTPQTE